MRADLILRGGRVVTLDAARSSAQAVAVRGGTIVAVGSDADVRPLAGRGTELVDLAGRVVVPGFQDAHIHASAGGLERIRCDLSGVHALEDYVRIVREYAESHPSEPWILGGGWAMDVFPGGVAGRALLDEVVPDRPVFLSNRDHHAAWVNGKALELAGVGPSTPEPSDGRIERDEHGGPAGTLQEGAMDLVDRVVPRPSVAEQERGILAAQTFLHSLGITAWQEAIVGDYAVAPDCFDAYVSLDERGQLRATVVGALWLDRDGGDERFERLRERRSRAAEGSRFRATSAKIMQDGVVENRTAALLEPYLEPDGSPAASRGLEYFEADELKRHVTRLDADGFQVHIHAIGDRAVRHALDAIEAARAANGPNDHRHHVSHIQVVHPRDVPRFRALNVVANAQPLWACTEPQMTELTLPILGPERSSWQYPFGSLVASGATLAGGSDWPVSSPDVLDQVHVAVNRTMPPGYLYGDPASDQEPFLPGERVDLPTALGAFTIGSAYVNHLDETRGSIEVGKTADLAVLSDDPFAKPPAEIGETVVDLTFVDGTAVYERDR